MGNLRLVPDEWTASIIPELFELKAAGATWLELARWLDQVARKAIALRLGDARTRRASGDSARWGGRPNNPSWVTTAIGLHGDLVVRGEVVGDRQPGRWVGEPQAGEPGAVLERPGLRGPPRRRSRGVNRTPQSVAGAHQIGSDVLPAALPISQLRLLDRRNGHDCHSPAGGRLASLTESPLSVLTRSVGAAIRAPGAHTSARARAGRSRFTHHPR